MNIIRDGLILVVYMFIIIVLYMFTSQPFHEMTSTFAGLDIASDAATQNTFTSIDTIYAFMYVLLAGIPLFWFIMRVFQRDPTWGYYR